MPAAAPPTASCPAVFAQSSSSSIPRATSCDNGFAHNLHANPLLLARCSLLGPYSLLVHGKQKEACAVFRRSSSSIPRGGSSQRACAASPSARSGRVCRRVCVDTRESTPQNAKRAAGGNMRRSQLSLRKIVDHCGIHSVMSTSSTDIRVDAALIHYFVVTTAIERRRASSRSNASRCRSACSRAAACEPDGPRGRNKDPTRIQPKTAPGLEPCARVRSVRVRVHV